jgi:hypothetical protein
VGHLTAIENLRYSANLLLSVYTSFRPYVFEQHIRAKTEMDITFTSLDYHDLGLEGYAADFRLRLRMVVALNL